METKQFPCAKRSSCVVLVMLLQEAMFDYIENGARLSKIEYELRSGYEKRCIVLLRCRLTSIAKFTILDILCISVLRGILFV